MHQISLKRQHSKVWNQRRNAANIFKSYQEGSNVWQDLFAGLSSDFVRTNSSHHEY